MKTLKIEVSSFVVAEMLRCYGQNVTHAEVRIENEAEWNKNKEVIMPHLEWYAKYRRFGEDLQGITENAGLFFYMGNNHAAFHDINGTRERFAMFVLTDGKYDTM